MTILSYDDINILYISTKYINIIQLSMIIHETNSVKIPIHRDEFLYATFIKVVENINKVLTHHSCSLVLEDVALLVITPKDPVESAG